jgi:hypothetical protein
VESKKSINPVLGVAKEWLEWNRLALVKCLCAHMVDRVTEMMAAAELIYRNVIYKPT